MEITKETLIGEMLEYDMYYRFFGYGSDIQEGDRLSDELFAETAKKVMKKNGTGSGERSSFRRSRSYLSLGPGSSSPKIRSSTSFSIKLPPVRHMCHSMRDARPLCSVTTRISGRLNSRGIAELPPSPRETSITQRSPR